VNLAVFTDCNTVEDQTKWQLLACFLRVDPIELGKKKSANGPESRWIPYVNVGDEYQETQS
jgi:hypothetical protein